MNINSSVRGRFHIATVMEQVKKDYTADVAQANTNQSTQNDKKYLTDPESLQLKTNLSSTFNFVTKYSSDFRDSSGAPIAHVNADEFVSSSVTMLEKSLNEADMNKDGYLSRYEQITGKGFDAITRGMAEEYMDQEVN